MSLLLYVSLSERLSRKCVTWSERWTCFKVIHPSVTHTCRLVADSKIYKRHYIEQLMSCVKLIFCSNLILLHAHCTVICPLFNSIIARVPKMCQINVYLKALKVKFSVWHLVVVDYILKRLKFCFHSWLYHLKTIAFDIFYRGKLKFSRCELLWRVLRYLSVTTFSLHRLNQLSQYCLQPDSKCVGLLARNVRHYWSQIFNETSIWLISK